MLHGYHILWSATCSYLCLSMGLYTNVVIWQTFTDKMLEDISNHERISHYVKYPDLLKNDGI